MESYNCLVRLNGELGQEVPKINVSAAHIIMMQAEHGGDAVHSIALHSKAMKIELENVKMPQLVTQKMMRAFLEKEFGVEKVGKAFGTFHGTTLPETLQLTPKTTPMKNKLSTKRGSISIADAEPGEGADEDNGIQPDDDIIDENDLQDEL